VVSINMDVRSPFVHHLGDERVDLLGLELHVVPVHVVAGLVGATAHLSPVGVHEGKGDHDDVLKEAAQVAADQILGHELDRLLG